MKTQKIFSTVLPLGVSFALALTVGWTGQAQATSAAFWQRHSASDCTLYDAVHSYTYQSVMYFLDANYASCPILDTNTMPKTAIGPNGVTTHGINVHVHSTSTLAGAQFSVAACIQNYGSTGGSCGTPATTTAGVPNDYLLSVSPSVFDTSDWGYLSITSPALASGNGPSWVYGYFVEAPAVP